MSEDLIDWLRAQLDDDQRAAEMAGWGNAVWTYDRERLVVEGPQWPVAARKDPDGRSPLNDVDGEFIARHDPARVLREVESLRKIIDNCSDWIENPVQGWEIDRADELTLKLDVGPTLLRLLAAIFSGRPGFREEWRPQ